MLYLGSNSPLTKIEPEIWSNINRENNEWISAVKPLSIQDVNDANNGILSKFIERYIVYAGSFEGCGCGFNACIYDKDNNDDEEEVMRALASIRSRKALHDYILAHNVSSVYGCWVDDEDKCSNGKMLIVPETILDRYFEFPERVMMTINRKCNSFL